MNIKDIQKGKKYYHITAGDRKEKVTGLREKEVATVYVLEVNTKTKQVLASINRFPAQWFSKSKYARWKETKPETLN